MVTIFMKTTHFDNINNIITIGFCIGKIQQSINSYITPKLSSKFPPQLYNDLIILKNSIASEQVK